MGLTPFVLAAAVVTEREGRHPPAAGGSAGGHVDGGANTGAQEAATGAALLAAEAIGR